MSNTKKEKGNTLVQFWVEPENSFLIEELEIACSRTLLKRNKQVLFILLEWAKNERKQREEFQS